MSPSRQSTAKRGRLPSSAADEPSTKKAKTAATHNDADLLGQQTPIGNQGQPQQPFPDLSIDVQRLACSSMGIYPNTVQQQAGVPAALANFRSHIAQRCGPQGLRVAGNFTLNDANLQVPGGLSAEELRRRHLELWNESKYQENNPPILPPSQVAPVAPKEHIEEFYTFPEGIAPAERKRREAKNNEIAQQLQRIDRERNNMAAKRSRQSRLEALANFRATLNEKTAECAWFRLRVVGMGGSAREWDAVPAEVKEAMVQQISDQVGLVDREKVDQKKKEEAAKRKVRHQVKLAEKKRAVERDAVVVTPASGAQMFDQEFGAMGFVNPYRPSPGEDQHPPMFPQLHSNVDENCDAQQLGLSSMHENAHGLVEQADGDEADANGIFSGYKCTEQGGQAAVDPQLQQDQDFHLGNGGSGASSSS